MGQKIFEHFFVKFLVEVHGLEGIGKLVSRVRGT